MLDGQRPVDREAEKIMPRAAHWCCLACAAARQASEVMLPMPRRGNRYGLKRTRGQPLAERVTTACHWNASSPTADANAVITVGALPAEANLGFSECRYARELLPQIRPVTQRISPAAGADTPPASVGT